MERGQVNLWSRSHNRLLVSLLGCLLGVKLSNRVLRVVERGVDRLLGAAHDVHVVDAPVGANNDVGRQWNIIVGLEHDMLDLPFPLAFVNAVSVPTERVRHTQRMIAAHFFAWL
jgi:hypothetical protein